MAGDERIPGDGDFVEEVLKHAKEKLARKYQLQAEGFDTGQVVERIAYLMQISPEEVLAAGKKRKTVAAGKATESFSSCCESRR